MPRKCMVHSNHMNMARFPDRKDPGYREVSGELRRYIQLVVDQMDGLNRHDG